MSDVDLTRLAEEHGVASAYQDWRGREVPVAVDTLRHVLTALGLDVSDPRTALEESRARRVRRLLPPAVVARVGREPRLRLPPQARVWVESAADAFEGTVADAPPGRHVLHVEHGRRHQSAPLLVVPDRLETAPSRRSWGFMTQLYSARSRGSWGMGDTRDLADLCEWSARDLGADFALINPVHATEPVPPIEPSPYLPTSRRYASPLYIRVEDVPEYGRLDPLERDRVQRLGRPLRQRARTADLIDRDTVWEAKRAALEILYRIPRTPAREVAYQDYLEREGSELVEYATWCALAEEYGSDYRTWPERLRDVTSQAVGREVLRRWSSVDFHRWVQWILDEQLATAQERAKAAGMPIGVLHDLAVGVQGRGADAWLYREVITPGVSVGAPPDEFNRQGQDWAQPPWHPTRLARTGYRPFSRQLHQTMRHAGGVRVDHVMGLFRLWWIPEGASPAEGTYVRYDHEGMVGALVLAARQHGNLVVGEDLGTVEPWVREHLAERGILGTSVLWFERDGAGRPLRPEEWRTDVLGSIATHDLPPAASALSGEYVELRHQLGVLPRPVEQERAAASRQIAQWRDLLVELGLLDADTDPAADPAAVIAALHAYLAATPARMLGVALTDVVGDRRMQNQPGTHESYPNWRVPLTNAEGEPVLLDELVSGSRATTAVYAAVRPLLAGVESARDEPPR